MTIIAWDKTYKQVERIEKLYLERETTVAETVDRFIINCKQFH